MLHQVFVEGVAGLQFGNECGCNDIIDTIIDYCHLTLKIIDVALKGFSPLQLGRKEMIVVLLKLLL